MELEELQNKLIEIQRERDEVVKLNEQLTKDNDELRKNNSSLIEHNNQLFTRLTAPSATKEKSPTPDDEEANFEKEVIKIMEGK